VGRDTRESANELRAVAALIVTGPSPALVGPCTLVSNGTRTYAFSSAELLRAAPEPLAIALTLDGTKTLPVTAWQVSRTPQMGFVDLGEVTFGPELDVAPLPIGSVCATVDTRGAPSALVTVQPNGAGFSRRVIPVHVDALDSGGMADEVVVHVASPDDPTDGDAKADGAPLITWMPADPLLGRAAETVAVALACTCDAGTRKPREQPPLAELHALTDLGRVLPWHRVDHEPSNDLGQVAGEWDVDSAPMPDREGD
jgi:hypothetical protein